MILGTEHWNAMSTLCDCPLRWPSRRAFYFVIVSFWPRSMLPLDPSTLMALVAKRIVCGRFALRKKIRHQLT